MEVGSGLVSLVGRTLLSCFPHVLLVLVGVHTMLCAMCCALRAVMCCVPCAVRCTEFLCAVCNVLRNVYYVLYYVRTQSLEASGQSVIVLQSADCQFSIFDYRFTNLKLSVPKIDSMLKILFTLYDIRSIPN